MQIFLEPQYLWEKIATWDKLAPVEERVLSFWRVLLETIAPAWGCINNNSPLWLKKSGWTAKLALMCHLAMESPSYLNTGWRSWNFLRYLTRQWHLSQSFVFGCRTLPLRTLIVGVMSGLEQPNTKSPFGTTRWNTSLLESPNNLPSLFSKGCWTQVLELAFAKIFWPPPDDIADMLMLLDVVFACHTKI